MSILGKFTRPRAAASPPSYAPRHASSGLSYGMGVSNGGQTDALSKTGSVGTLFAIVNRISTSTAMVEWGLYRKPKDGRVVEDAERDPVARHAALELWRTPNAFMTRHELVELCQQHLDLVGECFLVVVKAGNIPFGLWPVRPDRIDPVPHPTKFLAGYVYRDPDGQKIPLAVDDVIHVKLPNPLDPYCGLGPVQSILVELDASAYSAQWNRNFFLNSARPGGLIEVERRLSDEEFDELAARWREQHQGTANAHRVAIIEQGRWVENAFTMRDMEFPQLRMVSRDTIMEAFGMSKPMLGITEDVNRANAEASIYMFARYMQVPRLERWRNALNHRLLPMFGSTGKSVEFDYEDPVAKDSEQAALDRDSRVRSVQMLSTLPGYKFDMEALLAAYDLPQVPFDEIELPGVNAPPPKEPAGATRAGAGQSGKSSGKDEAGQSAAGKSSGGKSADGDGDGMVGEGLWKQSSDRDISAGVGKPPAEEGGAGSRAPAPSSHVSRETPRAQAPEWDSAEFDRDYRLELADLLASWEDVEAEQRAELREQIAAAVNDLAAGGISAGALAKLAELAVDAGRAGRRLLDSLVSMWRKAAAGASREALAGGVHVGPADPVEGRLRDVAQGVAAALANALAQAASREAMRRAGEGKSGEQVAREVDQHLRDLKNANLAAALGAALHGTANNARMSTWADGPVGSVYATEVLDKNTCSACREIDGQFICTTDDLTKYYQLYTDLGGYLFCHGNQRCRGTVTGSWSSP